VKERAWSAGLPSSAEKDQLIIMFTNKMNQIIAWVGK